MRQHPNFMKPPLRELISPKLSLNCGDEIMSKSNDTTKVRELTEAELDEVSGGFMRATREAVVGIYNDYIRSTGTLKALPRRD